MTKLLIISFDAVGDRVLDRMTARPNMASFLRDAALVRNVRSVFLTNTYPVHASVVTGLPPSGHGLVSNTPAFPERYPVWNYRASLMKGKPLWVHAREKGLTTASVLWPVTGGAKTINWNLPEIMPRPGDNQISLNLKNGSKVMLLQLFLKYRHLLDGIRQPALDRFAASCALDILRRHKPGLALVHLTAYDTLCHENGEDFDKLESAFQLLDENLGRLLDAVDGDTNVIVFSDHAQLPLHTTLYPNDDLVAMGLLTKDTEGNYRSGESGCFIECCGGSAFFYPGKADPEKIAQVREKIADSADGPGTSGAGFNRFLRPEEMAECGRSGLPFGFCAKPGYEYAASPRGHEEKGQHGYPCDYDGYDVFYAVRGQLFPKGEVFDGRHLDDRSFGGLAYEKRASLLDIAPLALRALG
ncbi:alkaline phosphatase family protein [Spirochaetia bacterium]|nr:alkaline phosphatase family protein [Spirochaetia bacterium]